MSDFYMIDKEDRTTFRVYEHEGVIRNRRDIYQLVSRRDPIEVLMLHADGSHAWATVGPDLKRGQCLQLFIPGNTFHTARIAGRRRWFLGASTEWPGVVPSDVEIGDLDALAAKYPAVAADLRAIAKG